MLGQAALLRRAAAGPGSEGTTLAHYCPHLGPLCAHGPLLDLPGTAHSCPSGKFPLFFLVPPQAEVTALGSVPSRFIWFGHCQPFRLLFLLLSLLLRCWGANPGPCTPPLSHVPSSISNGDLIQCRKCHHLYVDSAVHLACATISTIQFQDVFVTPARTPTPVSGLPAPPTPGSHFLDTPQKRTRRLVGLASADLKARGNRISGFLSAVQDSSSTRGTWP